MTGVKIIGVNLLALLVLFAGIMFTSQYQQQLIENKLRGFNIELGLISYALETHLTQSGDLNDEKSKEFISKIKAFAQHRVRIFGNNGLLSFDSEDLQAKETYAKGFFFAEDRTLVSLETLKGILEGPLKLISGESSLPVYKEKNAPNIYAYEAAKNALKGEYSLVVYTLESGSIFLTGAAPIFDNKVNTKAVVFLSREAEDINREIEDVWMNVLGIFIGSLIISIFMSIYLSGIITSPLKKLAKAAEGVRKGRLSYDDLPDFSDRKDEIAELSISLRAMTKSLGDRRDAMERFAADVSHELKNPLTSIRSAIESLGIAKKASDRKKLIEIAQEDVKRMDKLISDISRTSRLDTQLARDKYEPVDLIAILKRILNDYRNPMDRVRDDDSNEVIAKGVTITLKNFLPEDTPSYVWGKEERLEQVFQNLLSNALSFSEPDTNIKIEIHRDGQSYVKVSVSDQGPGIKEAHLQSIFDRFYSYRPEGIGRSDHSGLGLSICEQIVEAMNGRIYAQNIAEQRNGKKHIVGAKFTIILQRVAK